MVNISELFYDTFGGGPSGREFVENRRALRAKGLLLHNANPFSPNPVQGYRTRPEQSRMAQHYTFEDGATTCVCIGPNATPRVASSRPNSTPRVASLRM